MQLKRLLTDERAVSPVIGVILMVAITVILAAVIGTFVLGLGEKVGQSAPQASFSFDFSDDGNGFNGDTGTTGDVVNITHEGGETIGNETLSVDGGDGGVTYESTGSNWGDGDKAVNAGDTIVYSGVNSGETIRVIWASQSGDSTNTIAKATAPQ